jgi:hypothetical protein
MLSIASKLTGNQVYMVKKSQLKSSSMQMILSSTAPFLMMKNNFLDSGTLNLDPHLQAQDSAYSKGNIKITQFPPDIIKISY